MNNSHDTRAKETLNILKECNAILENDHFVYVSGDHGSGWINKDIIFPSPKRVSRLTELLADTLKDIEFDIICGPATGGLTISQWTAHHVGADSIFSEHDPAWRDSSADEKKSGQRAPLILRRGYDKLVSGRKVVIVDDIINVGFSVLTTAEAVKEAGGEVVAIAALVNRGNIDMKRLDGIDLIYLLEYDIPEWPASECKLCRDGVPVNTEYAHGSEFVLNNR